MPEAVPYLIEIGKAIAAEVVRAAVDYAVSELLGLNNRSPSAEQIQMPVRQTIPPKQKAYGRGRLSGPYLYYATNKNWTMDVIALAKGPCDAIESFMLHDEEVTVDSGGIVQMGPDGRYQRAGGENDTIRILSRTGEIPSPVYSEVTTASGGEWTAAHRADGVATMAVLSKGVKTEIVQTVYPNGPVMPSAIGRWSLCYDWRKDSTMPGGAGSHRIDDPGSWEWSQNVIVCLLNDEVFERGQDFAYRFLPTLAWWSTAADICDEPVEQFAGGTAPRYTLFGFYKSNNPPKDLRARFLQCCDGLMIERGDGAFVVYAGKYYEPTVTIDEDRIRQVKWTRTRRQEDFVNLLVIAYQSPVHKWAMTETLPWADQDSIDTLGEQSAPLELPWVTNNSQSRRLGKATFARLTAGYVGEFTVDMSDEGDELQERYLRLRWAAGPSSVHDVVVEVTAATLDLIARTVRISVILADPEAYDWIAADEGAPPGVPDVTPPSPILEPEVVGAEIIYNGTAARLLVTIEDPGVESYGYVLQWRLVGDGSWSTEFPTEDLDSSDLLAFTTSILPQDAEIEAQIAFSTAGGSIGPFAYLGEFEVTGIPIGAITDESGAYLFTEAGGFIATE